MGKFVTRRDRESVVDSPESLFRALRPSDSGVRHLWAHQADLLRGYHALSDKVSDVAVELPTGAGKTLVGQLLGEFRRRTLGQRVAYVCPNSQLAAQAAEKAAGYGIPGVLLVGPRADYPRSDYTAFTRGKAIAFTNYHSIFNTNPAIDARTLVLDDAHAGEGAVADLWTVTTDRKEALYEAIVETVADLLPEPFLQRLGDDGLHPRFQRDVELVPPAAVASRGDVLRRALDDHARDQNAWSGRMIASQIGHCLVYVSWATVLIRPFIPPTAGHPAFAGAKQRIYMSATLGAGGELERSFGVRMIHRLPVPSGWDERGSGRRFFLFPAAAHDRKAVDACIAGAVERAEKAIVLAPSHREVEDFTEGVSLSVPVFRSGDAERDLTAFTKAREGVVLLANRYDGIDLPDESCRLVVLTGLPTATHLQERFLHDTLGAGRVLAERIRTRILQGAGRCTRNVRDYAAVLIRTDLLTDFCARDETLQSMHPELQAEMRFGLDNSENPDLDPLDLLDSFFAQDPDWLEADADIRDRAANAVRAPIAGLDELSAAAPIEVEAWQEIWRGEVRRAVDLAQQAADLLGGGNELRPYRAFWLYLAASWAAELAEGSEHEEDARRAWSLERDAAGAARSLRWRPRVLPKAPAPPVATDFDARAARAAKRLRQLGIRGVKFARKIEEVEALLAGDEATSFESGLEQLGKLLGFEAERPPGDAAPDSAWRDDGDDAWLLFEAKTEEARDDHVSVKETRQAATHHDWVKGRLGWAEPKASLTAIVSYKTAVDPTAAAVAKELTLVHPERIREIWRRTAGVHREVRSRARALSDAQLAAALSAGFRDRGLTTDDLLAELSTRRLADG